MSTAHTKITDTTIRLMEVRRNYSSRLINGFPNVVEVVCPEMASVNAPRTNGKRCPSFFQLG